MTVSNTEFKQGQVWWVCPPERANIPDPRQQLVLIVQADYFNQLNLPTVVCVPINYNWRAAEKPGYVMLPPRDTKLKRTAVANVTRLFAIDKRLFSEYVSTIPTWLLESVLDGVQEVLGR